MLSLSEAVEQAFAAETSTLIAELTAVIAAIHFLVERDGRIQIEIGTAVEDATVVSDLFGGTRFLQHQNLVKRTLIVLGYPVDEELEVDPDDRYIVIQAQNRSAEWWNEKLGH
jgi:hypothetical protein